VRAERVATAFGIAFVAVVLSLAVIGWEAPYKVVAKPLQERIHLGKEEDSAAAAVHEARPVPVGEPGVANERR
jgi:hypothetical protein